MRPPGEMDIDPVFGNSSAGLSGLWDEVQFHQVEFGFSQEVAALYGEPLWHAARTVVDVGTGNGWWLSRVAEHFADKEYLGIDVSGELIERARSRRHGEPTEYVVTDYLSAREQLSRRCGFLTARLFLQHVRDVAAALEVFAGLVVPGGGTVIIDSHDESRLFWPEVPAFRRFFEAYRAKQAQEGRDRGIAQRLPTVLKGSTRWRYIGASRITFPSTVGNNLAHYQDYYRLMLRIVEATRTIDFEFDEVRAEWERWCRDPRAYTHLSLDVVLLQRAADDEG